MPVRCNFCGSERCTERRVEYLYGYEGEYLLVPDMPVEICLDCGMVYYDAALLKEVERRFFAIRCRAEEPDYYLKIPAKAMA